MKKLLLLTLVTIVLYSCKKDDKTPASSPIALGNFYEGGYIFYIDGSGVHGLIAAPSDQGTAVWGCSTTSVWGTSKAIGTGNANTINIIANCSTPNKAADTCSNLVLNGYSDWYLPSIDELQLMHLNLHLHGIGGFNTSSGYWSSSEFGIPSAWVSYASYYMVFGDSNEYYRTTRMGLVGVRAIRSY